MAQLQQELQITHKNIINYLIQYQTENGERKKSSELTQIVAVLQTISSFDPENIKNISNKYNDNFVTKYTRDIAEKIIYYDEEKKVFEDKREKELEQNLNIQRKSLSKATKNIEQIISNSTHKQTNQKRSFFGRVLNVFDKKLDKAVQIKLPDKEQAYKWDPVRKIYIFEGEEPEPEKVIPKPPPNLSKKNLNQSVIRTKLQTDLAELDAMIAPPTFNRKGTGIRQTKTKKDEQILMVEAQRQIFTHEGLVQKINREFQFLLLRLSNHYLKVVSQRQQLPTKGSQEVEIQQLLRITQVTFSHKLEISHFERIILQKMSINSEQNDQTTELMQKILSTQKSSNQIYSNVSSSIDQLKSRPTDSIAFLKQKSKLLESEIDQLHEKVQQSKEIINFLKSQIQSISGEKQNLEKQNEELNDLNLSLKSTIKSLEEQFQERNKILQTLVYQSEDLKVQIEKLKSEKVYLQNSLKASEQSFIAHTQKLNLQLSQQKTRIQASLKNYEQREKSYTKILHTYEDHGSIIKQFEEAIHNENQLFKNIIEKRIQVAKSQDNNFSQSFRLNEFSQDKKLIIFQLSDIISNITENHLDQLQAFNLSYNILQRKHTEAKKIIKKISTDSINLNLILNRSVSSLKSLIEAYKNSQKDAEDRAARLELKCQKMEKKLSHYKYEEQLNISYLSNLKSYQISNQKDQNETPLKNASEESAENIDLIQRQINHKQNITIMQLHKDFSDKLIHQQCNQTKILEMEMKSKYKQNGKDLQSVRQLNEDLKNTIALLELKLLNSKQRIDELVGKEKQKFINLESIYEKKVKILRNEIQQSKQNQRLLKSQLKHLEQIIRERQTNLKQNDVKQLKYLEKIKDKQNENNELLLFVQDLRKKCQQLDINIEKTQSQNRLLLTFIEKLQLNIRQVTQQHQNQINNFKHQEQKMNERIQLLNLKYSEYQKEQIENQSQLRSKIACLNQDLAQSNLQTEKLLVQIENQSRMLDTVLSKIKQIREQDEKKWEGIFNQQAQQTKEINKKLEIVNKELQLRNEELEKITNELENANRLVFLTKKDLEFSKILIEQQKSKISNFNMMEGSYQSEIIQLKALISELERQKQQFSQISISLENQIRQYNEQVGKYKQQLSLVIEDKFVSVKALEEQNQILSKICLKLKEQSQSQVQESEIIRQIAELQEALILKQAQMAGITNNLQHMKQQIGQYKFENQTFLKELEDYRKEICELKIFINEITQDLKIKSGIIQELECQKVHLLLKTEEKVEEIRQAAERLQQIENGFQEEKERIIQQLIKKDQEFRQLTQYSNGNIEKFQTSLRNQRVESFQRQQILKSKINFLQEEIKKITQILQYQKKEIGLLKLEDQNYKQASFNEEAILKDVQIEISHNQLIEREANIQDLRRLQNITKQEYEVKIQNVQKQLKQFISLKNENKKLEQKYKNLEQENTNLLSEKAELMRSNSYLIEINQKLVAQKSPHNAIVFPKVSKANQGKFIQQKVTENAQKNLRPEIKPQKSQSTGFFGSLSSLFLTPTERDRLVKKPVPK